MPTTSLCSHYGVTTTDLCVLTMTLVPTTSLRTHCEVYAKDMSVLHYDNNVRDVSLCTLRHQCHSPVCEHTSDLMPHRAICVHLTCSHYDVNSKELFVNTYKISVTGLLRTHYEAIHLLLLTCLCSHCAMRLMLMTCLCSHYRVNATVLSVFTLQG